MDPEPYKDAYFCSNELNTRVLISICHVDFWQVPLERVRGIY